MLGAANETASFVGTALVGALVAVAGAPFRGIAGTVSPVEFLAPENVSRILAVPSPA